MWGGGHDAMKQDIYRPEKHRDEIRELKREQKKLLSSKFKIEKRLSEIEGTLKVLEVERVLNVTEHAIQRFLERVQKVPTAIAKKILTEPGLLQRYMKHGPGKYRLKKYPHVTVVISDFSILTCYIPVPDEELLPVMDQKQ